VKFHSLSSSSQGNCYYLSSNNTSLLIDAGISAKKIENSLFSIGTTAAELKGIILTHEHIDHIRSIGTLAKRYNLPIYATPGTWQALEQCKCPIPYHLRHFLKESQPLELANLTVHWQETLHDCNQPICLKITDGEKSFGLVTDTGELDSAMVSMLYDTNILIAEANHDIQMLKNGPYPLSVKNRILSRYGHLSNEACAHGLLQMIGPSTQHIMLAHLSQQNNTPALAYKTIGQILTNECSFTDYNLWVARAESISSLLEV